MYILSGETKLKITSYVVNRYDNQRGLVLSINTTKDNISLVEFDTFCTNIKENKLDILVYNDYDELEKTLRGFYHNCYISIDNNMMTAEITNESENTYQIGILQDKNNILENTIVETYGDLTNTQLALVEQYNAKIALEETVANLQNEIKNNQEKIQSLELMVTELQTNINK